MALEDIESAGKYISDLVSTNPLSTDSPGLQGDNHIRGIKNTLKLSLPTLDRPVYSPEDTYTELKALTFPSTQVIVPVMGRATVGDGAHGFFISVSGDQSANITADSEEGVWVPPDSDTSGASGAYKRLYSGAINVKWFGAKGDGATDDYTAIAAAIAYGKDTYFPEGDYRIATTQDNEGIFKLTTDGVRIFGDGYNSRIYPDVAFTGTPSTSLFHRPAVGDNYGSLAAGGDNITIENLQLDGNRSGSASYAGFSWGISIDGGTGHNIRNIWSHGWEKGGIAVYSFAADTDVEVSIENVRCYNNNGTGGQGISIATLGVSSDAVRISNAVCYGNTLGIDASTGSLTVSGSKLYGNTVGGAKSAGGDSQLVTFIDCDFFNNTTTGAQGFYTNGSFGVLQFSRCKFSGNDSNGIQIAHAGNVLIDNCDVNSNGAQGVYISANSPSVTISSVISRSNTNRGFLFASGYITASGCFTSTNGQEGYSITTTDAFSGAALVSYNDCVTSGTQGLLFQPGTTVTTYSLASATIIDDRGTPELTLGVSVNANCSGMKIGSIVSSGPTTAPLSDSGSDTTYFDNGAGNALIGTSAGRLGVYGAAPVLKQTVTGSKGSNAALTSLLTALSNIGLITDSST